MNVIRPSYWLTVVVLLCAYHLTSSYRSMRRQYQDLCLIPGLKTPEGPLPVGCRADCLSGKKKKLNTGTKCIHGTLRQVKAMPNYTSKWFPAGACGRYGCKPDGTRVWCTKLPVFWMGVE
uniref:Evasin n=1 Tax=Amblyomma triste TaxID=251400 RepID=A0A023G256_AMBTT